MPDPPLPKAVCFRLSKEWMIPSYRFLYEGTGHTTTQHCAATLFLERVCDRLDASEMPRRFLKMRSGALTTFLLISPRISLDFLRDWREITKHHRPHRYFDHFHVFIIVRTDLQASEGPLLTRSKRPGRTSAASRACGRLVAAMTRIPCASSRPSISVSRELSSRSWTDTPPPPPAALRRKTLGLSPTRAAGDKYCSRGESDVLRAGKPD